MTDVAFWVGCVLLIVGIVWGCVLFAHPRPQARPRPTNPAAPRAAARRERVLAETTAMGIWEDACDCRQPSGYGGLALGTPRGYAEWVSGLAPGYREQELLENASGGQARVRIPLGRE